MSEGEPPIAAGDGSGSDPGRVRRWFGRRTHDTADAVGDGCSDGCDLDGCDGCDGCSGCDLALISLAHLAFVGRGVDRQPRPPAESPPAELPPAELPSAMTSDAALSVGTRCLLALLRFYKRVVSPRVPAVCRYTPSCSVYAAEAVRRHGPRRGLRLAYRRVRRCNPAGGRGVDPVPG